jgi:hypothetical protein
MVHTERYYKLKRLQNLCEDLSHTIKEMAFNEDLPVFDTELEHSLKISYYEIMNSISELRNNLGL